MLNIIFVIACTFSSSVLIPFVQRRRCDADVNIREEEEASDNFGSDLVEVSWVVYEEPLASVLSRYEQNDCLL